MKHSRIVNWIEHGRRYSPAWLRNLLPRWFKNIWIDLEWRFYRSKNRHLNKEVLYPQKPILVISIPKSGTHLIESLLLTLPGMRMGEYLSSGIEGVTDRKMLLTLGKQKLSKAQPGQTYRWHLPYDPEIVGLLNDYGLKRLFLYRDPRDYVVSFYNFIMKRPPHSYHIPYDEAFRAMNSDNDRILACIQGWVANRKENSGSFSPTSVPNVGLLYQRFLGWKNDPGALSLRYEDLVSDLSNGNSNHSYPTMNSILRYLNLADSPLSPGAYSEWIETGGDTKKSPTFRSGKIGSCKQNSMRSTSKYSKKLQGVC